MVATDPTPRPVRDWAPAQRAVFDEVCRRNRNVGVDAVAGSGKTTTLIEALFRYRAHFPAHRVLFVAFSKNIADTLKDRVPRGVVAQTLHSLGFGVIRRQHAQIEVEPRKAYHQARQVLGRDGSAKQVTKLAALLSSAYTQLAPISEDLVAALAERFGLDLPSDLPTTVQLLRDLDAAMRRDSKFICYDEMLTRSLAPGYLFPRYDLVMVDEAQDLNPVQEEMIDRLVGLDTRLVFVGDPHQSIYAFRGADHDAMARLTARFDALQLPLSTSYRCPTAVVEAAKTLVPHIAAASGAPAGEVIRTGEIHEILPKLPPGSLVLGRRNATLVRWCLWLVSSGIRARMLGRDIGGSIVAPIDQTMRTMPNARFADVVIACFSDLLRRSTAAHEAGDTSKSAQLHDMALTVEAVASDCSTYQAFVQRVESLFVDDQEADAAEPILCSTIHRAKGREADHVAWLEPGFSRWLRGVLTERGRLADVQQEDNICYVAITRARKALYMLDGR